MQPPLAQQQVNDLMPAVPQKRNHLSSSQQLLVKQTIALKKSIDFKRLEERIASVNHDIAITEANKQNHYKGFMLLIAEAEKDVSQLKQQGMSTHQLMMYFAKRHNVSNNALAEQLKTTVSAMLEGLERIKQQFVKIYGPGFFKKSGALDAERFEEWVIELANLYQTGHSALHNWHRDVADTLNAASSTEKDTGADTESLA